MPILAATAATIRVWSGCKPPMVTSVSAPDAIASGIMFSSLRSLLPPNAIPEVQSSRLAKISTLPPRGLPSRSSFPMGLGQK